MLLDDLAPVRAFSASAVYNLAVCPEQFRRQYVAREERHFANPQMVRGSAFHEARRMANLVKLWTGVKLPVAELDDIYEDTFNARAALAEIEPSALLEEERELGRRMSRAYHRDLADTFFPVESESRFEGYVPGVPVPVIGFLDTVSSEQVIIETKSSNKRVSTPKPEWRIAALVYIAARGMHFQTHVAVATKTDAYAYALPMTHATPRRIEAGRELLAKAAATVEDLDARYGRNNAWPTWGLSDSWACNSCPFGPRRRKSCPAWT